MPFRGVTKLTCGKCGKGFKSATKLMHHDQRKHPIGNLKAQALKSMTVTEGNLCPYCGRHWTHHLYGKDWYRCTRKRD